jgi:5-methylcytosine-specific restriction protein B
MQPRFWKLSQGAREFELKDIIESINSGLVYVHKDTKGKATSATTQAEDFIGASIGDYFYLTHGNEGIYLLGQFIGPANLFSKYGEGWLEREFKFVFASNNSSKYTGEHKWWTPNDNSTFTRVPENEIELFEREILEPFFGVKLENFGL